MALQFIRHPCHMEFQAQPPGVVCRSLLPAQPHIQIESDDLIADAEQAQGGHCGINPPGQAQYYLFLCHVPPFPGLCGYRKFSYLT